MTPAPQCCLFCGRETTAKCRICGNCLRTSDERQRRQLADEERLEREGRPDTPLEDDYGENSNADSVCDDGEDPR